MKDWAPRLSPNLDYSKLQLDGEQGFVLSRIDGSTTVTHLTQLTGLPQGKVRRILGQLLQQGALAREGAPAELGGVPGTATGPAKPQAAGASPPHPVKAPAPEADDDEDVQALALQTLALHTLAEQGAVEDLDGPPTLLDENEGGDTDEHDLPADDDEVLARAGLDRDDLEDSDPGGDALDDDEALFSDEEDAAAPAEADPLADAPEGSDDAYDDGDEEAEGDEEPWEEPDAGAAEDEIDDELDDEEPERRDPARAAAEGEGAGDEEEAEEGEEAPAEDEAAAEEHARTWRRIFEEDLHPLDVDERVKGARQATEEVLCAYCFDPNPRVVAALLENMAFGLPHARLVAQHHRTASGLDHLGKRTPFVRDRQVQRWLYKNPQISDRLLRTILTPKRMADTYQLSLNRDASDRVRTLAKKAFRSKFSQGTAEERVTLIMKCEGRCLNLLIGLSLDGRTASLLTQRPMHSTLLIQNLARWPATPPPVLVHLFKQPLVARTPALKNMVLRHPNAPSQLKRKGPV